MIAGKRRRLGMTGTICRCRSLRARFEKEERRLEREREREREARERETARGGGSDEDEYLVEKSRNGMITWYPNFAYPYAVSILKRLLLWERRAEGGKKGLRCRALSFLVRK